MPSPTTPLDISRDTFTDLVDTLQAAAYALERVRTGEPLHKVERARARRDRAHDAMVDASLEHMADAIEATVAARVAHDRARDAFAIAERRLEQATAVAVAERAAALARIRMGREVTA